MYSKDTLASALGDVPHYTKSMVVHFNWVSYLNQYFPSQYLWHTLCLVEKGKFNDGPDPPIKICLTRQFEVFLHKRELDIDIPTELRHKVVTVGSEGKPLTVKVTISSEVNPSVSVVVTVKL